MGVIILIVIGIVVWMMFGNNSSEPKQTIQHSQKKADKEFEDTVRVIYIFSVTIVTLLLSE